jgi:hypothetical protein
MRASFLRETGKGQTKSLVPDAAVAPALPLGPAERRRIDVRYFGRGAAIRTRDLLNPIQVRYQAALRPELLGFYSRRGATVKLYPSRLRLHHKDQATAGKP